MDLGSLVLDNLPIIAVGILIAVMVWRLKSFLEYEFRTLRDHMNWRLDVMHNVVRDAYSLSSEMRELKNSLSSEMRALKETCAKRVENVKQEAKQDGKRDEMPSAQLWKATELPPIAYVKGSIEFGAKPGYKLTFIAGEAFIGYRDGNGEKKYVRVVFYNKGNGTYITIEPKDPFPKK